MAIKDLEKYSVEQLEKELIRRKEEKLAPPPKVKLDPDYSEVVKMVKGYIKEVDETGHDDADWEHYIYEAVLDAIYGPTIWEFFKKKLK